MSQAATRRPLLVWAIFLLHCVLALYGVAYALAAFGIAPIGEYLSPRWPSFRWNDHVIGLTWIIACCLGAYNLFFRKPHALTLFSMGGLIFLLPNLARYARFCLDRGCPDSSYLINVAASFSVFVVIGVLFVVALPSWPPRRVVRPET